ncbi:MAG TPA: site-specific integrase [Xanthobacteraceae bacterium]|nr:site-specific integrase [Xanthobacteraceae bacterium]
MPRLSAGAHLWLRPERRNKAGSVTHAAVWLIVDGKSQQSTECGRTDRAGAERALERFLNAKHTATAKAGCRDPAAIPTADVLAFYAERVVPAHARPKESLRKIERLVSFFAATTLADINGDLCRQFGKGRTGAGRREDLGVLKAAINFHRTEGRCDRIVSVVLPEKNAGRERWLTRSEAAKLIWEAWRYRERQKGKTTTRASRRHVAKFILVGLYTGTRAGAICAAALGPMPGRAFVDLERGIFYRRPTGATETKKRRPPVPLPKRLLAHLRRWKRRGQRFCVEWNRAPVLDVDKAFRRNAHEAGMPDVTPHVLRHTAATWQMQLGTDKWQAAGFLGMSVETLERTYGHHHPNHLTAARDAFDRRPERKGSANPSPVLRRNKPRLDAGERSQK